MIHWQHVRLLVEFFYFVYTTTAYRYIEYFWTLGSLFVAGMAWLVLSSPTGWISGWRALTLITSIPVVVSSVFSFIYLPESPKVSIQ